MIRAVLLWLVLALPLAAQDLPAPDYTSVNDFARLLTPDDTRILDQALIALHDDTGVEGTVVTMNKRAEYGGTDGLEAFATRLFNHWGVGDAQRNDGFMVLLLKDDRETRIELGKGYADGYNQIAGQIIENEMLPHFRRNDYSAGLRDGTLAVISRVAREHAAGAPPASLSPATSESGDGTAAPNERQQPWTLMPLIVGAGFFMLFSAVFLRSFSRNRNRGARGWRKCPDCRNRDLVTMESPVRDDKDDGGWSVSQTSVKTLCPKCGWSNEQRVDHDQTVTYAADGAVLSTLPHYSGRDGWSRRDRHRSDRSSRSSSSGSSGGFGGGSSSGGGSSGRW
ncbi:TPM domain-containing protein [Paracoccus xiamenensis]|uniref:TPM domain-containing protein n=1 Tax=Paracoccus xiamenensis TaxID=2714901 RepID=UPI00140822C5|nr:TPM domain-containing protein [Paracoccus xiamenensis]NHF71639.1 TPM domain-containing protein [Paracoccus xiamenensis]